MRGKPAAPAQSSVSPITMIFGAGVCFGLGFLALMVAPMILRTPHYVQVAPQEPPAPIAPAPVAAPAPAPAAVSPIVQEIKPNLAQSQPRLRTLADLAECKVAVATGKTWRGVGAADVAAAVGGNPRALSNSQIDEGCRRLAR